MKVLKIGADPILLTGAINQALLAIEATRSRGLDIAAVVLNDIDGRGGKDASLRYNCAEIKRLGRVRVVEVR